MSLNTKSIIANGDGLCFLNKAGEFEGFRVNRVEAGRLLPLQMPKIEKGTLVYRNSDVAFERILAGKTAERKIQVDFRLQIIDNRLQITMSDDDNVVTTLAVDVSGELANNPDKMQDTWCTQLSKLGGTIFEVKKIDLSCFTEPYFIPVSQIAEWRRQLVEAHELNRTKSYKRSLIEIKPTTHKYVVTNLDYHANIYNLQAKIFYEQHPDADRYRVTLYGSLSKTGVGHGTDRVILEVLAPIPTELGFSNAVRSFIAWVSSERERPSI